MIERPSGFQRCFSAPTAPHETFIPVNGSDALRIGAVAFMPAVADRETLRQAILRYVQM